MTNAINETELDFENRPQPGDHFFLQRVIRIADHLHVDDRKCGGNSRTQSTSHGGRSHGRRCGNHRHLGQKRSILCQGLLAVVLSRLDCFFIFRGLGGMQIGDCLLHFLGGLLLLAVFLLVATAAIERTSASFLAASCCHGRFLVPLRVERRVALGRRAARAA